VDSVRLLIYSIEERRAMVAATLERSERTLTVAGSVRSWRPRLFDRGVVAAATPNGVVFANTGNAALLRLALDGTAQTPWPLLSRRRPVTAAVVAAERDRQVQALEARRLPASAPIPGGVPAELARVQRERAENIEAYATFPELRSLLSGSDGTLWVEDYPVPAAATVRWYRVENGAATAWFDLPLSHRVLAVGHGLLLHVVQDDLGVETALVSRLDG
jgi:hypothetical protein